MKKIIALLLAVLSFCCLFTGCSEEETKKIIDSLNFNYSDSTPMTDEDVDKALLGNFEAIQKYSSWKKAEINISDKIKRIPKDEKQQSQEMEALIKYRADKDTGVYYQETEQGSYFGKVFVKDDYLYTVSEVEGKKGTKEVVPEYRKSFVVSMDTMIFGNDDALFYIFKKCDAKKLSDFGVKAFVTKEDENIVFTFKLTKEFLVGTFPEFCILGYVGGINNLFDKEGLTVDSCYAKYVFDTNGNFLYAKQSFKLTDVTEEGTEIEEATMILTEYTGDVTFNEDDFEEASKNDENV